MTKTHNNMKCKNLLFAGLVLIGFILNSCEKFLEIPPPPAKIPADQVFKDDDMATSALTGLYIGLYSGAGFAGGSNESGGTLAGLSADELRNNKNDVVYLQFQNNAIDPFSANVENLWGSMYQTIYGANSVLEGIEASTSLTTSVRRQLKGEALFIRAFCYFYLVNFFGDVPLSISTDYSTNNKLKRVAASEVYNQIKADLSEAEALLNDNYVSAERIRANKSAATALLSRVYIYTGDWPRAEDKATNIIEKSGVYSLSALNSVFKATSKEAIWQLRPNDEASYTNEGFWFSTINGPSNNVLRAELISDFESGDLRQVAWTTSIIANNDTIYLPTKYKRFEPDGLTDEYSMVLRLTEIYLIRAEARLKQDELSSAIADLDIIRDRAGLPLIQTANPSISKENLLLAIERERRIEFFTEWGHRWLDLKRWGRAQAVLSSLKPDWSNNDLLYPIPVSELNKNPNLKPQNEGY